MGKESLFDENALLIKRDRDRERWKDSERLKEVERRRERERERERARKSARESVIWLVAAPKSMLCRRPSANLEDVHHLGNTKPS